MKILHELNEEGRTIILITHDNDIARQATRAIRIIDGKWYPIPWPANCRSTMYKHSGAAEKSPPIPLGAAGIFV